MLFCDLSGDTSISGAILCDFCIIFIYRDPDEPEADSVTAKERYPVDPDAIGGDVDQIT